MMLKTSMNKRKKTIGRRGEISQTFTFLTAAIVMGVILIFGGIAVTKLVHNTKEIEQAEFRSSFQKEIGKISSSYGSVRVTNLTGLSNYNRMCVFELGYDISEDNNGQYAQCSILDEFPLIRGDLFAKSANVFLLTDSEIGDKFLEEKVSFRSGSTHCACANITKTGMVGMKLEGTGRKAIFSFLD